ncbi:unnamed protein product [Urochloa decumbens]|uniref:Subtilisin-like protease n=1 Tax=Urochloa decumbens TaxID=240449 RepID=A0ABC8ZZS8_9POAL
MVADNARLVWVACLLLAAATAVAAVVESEAEALSTYIVHVAQAHAPRSSRPSMLSSAYSYFLRDHLPEHVALQTPRLLYSYAHAATGFAARLTEAQAVHLASQESVLAVVPDMTHQLHTTQSPSFLGLSESSGLLQASGGGANIVIGFIDSGVYPKDRASFTAPPSLPPPPSTFHGSCVSAPDFNASAYCNNKLVGAKFFKLGYEAAHGSAIEETESSSPLDTNGHGTHTASTAAGSAVVDAAFFDYARGKAVGMAPAAHIAAYKACWAGQCTSSDVLMAFDEAIKDGVNVISVSSGLYRAPFYSDSTAVGAFSAIRKGIIVSASAGNYGPGESTVFNVAPWILTAGASTINRQFLANVVLGNGENFTGTSIYEGTPLGTDKIPLVYGGDVGSSECEAGKLNTSEVVGKIVVCDAGINSRQVKGEAVKLAGGAGAILVSSKVFGEQSVATAHVLPAAGVSFATAENIKKYIRDTESPVGTIVFLGTVIGRTTRPAPRMASFSGRGPNFIAPEILKPDVTAPGVDILAAWTGENSPSGLDSDPRRVKFNIMYGTSVACAHVSGIVALLRQVHPDWSPAAIKSALMTTAYNVDNAGDIIKDMSTSKASTPFARGAGHVDPNSAADPGLVYNASTNDYISFLCALRYTAQQIAVLTRDGSMTDCSRRPGSVGDHNYPAFSVVLRSGGGAVTQRRVVQNVGSNTTTTYTPNVTSPAGVRVTVQPSTLKFSLLRKTQEYAVTFTPLGNVTNKYTFGSIVWTDGKYKVTSPIAITWPATQVAAM